MKRKIIFSKEKTDNILSQEEISFLWNILEDSKRNIKFLNAFLKKGFINKTQYNLISSIRHLLIGEGSYKKYRLVYIGGDHSYCEQYSLVKKFLLKKATRKEIVFFNEGTIRNSAFEKEEIMKFYKREKEGYFFGLEEINSFYCCALGQEIIDIAGINAVPYPLLDLINIKKRILTFVLDERTPVSKTWNKFIDHINLLNENSREFFIKLNNVLKKYKINNLEKMCNNHFLGYEYIGDWLKLLQEIFTFMIEGSEKLRMIDQDIIKEIAELNYDEKMRLNTTFSKGHQLLRKKFTALFLDRWRELDWKDNIIDILDSQFDYPKDVFVLSGSAHVKSLKERIDQ